MIKDYKKYFVFVQNHKFIFAPNSSGKTLFSESLLEVNSENNDYILLEKDKVESIIKNELLDFKPNQNLDKD
jgi:ABC-type cobalamin/Fe3+-siderophores transport system ATPase subunit